MRCNKKKNKIFLFAFLIASCVSTVLLSACIREAAKETWAETEAEAEDFDPFYECAINDKVEQAADEDSSMVGDAGELIKKEEKESETRQVESDQPITFSLDSGYYDHSVNIEIISDIEGEIFYTDDGDDPFCDGSIYINTLTYEISDELQVIPLKAGLQKPDGEQTVYEQVYVLCSDMNAYGNISVMSLSLDHEDLYGDTGLMDHYLDDDYAGTKCAHAAWINEEGAVEYEDSVGLDISGGTSRVFDIKSLMIKADEAYGSSGKITIDAELNRPSTSKYHFVDEFGSLRLRSGSQDMMLGNIRSAIASSLALSSGFDGGNTSRRCLVYLNGEFYGIFDLQEKYSSGLLADRFGLNGGEEARVRKQQEANLKNDYGIYDAIMSAEKNSSRDEIEEIIDMDSYLFYFALNILMNNTDWPDNNFEYWYYGEVGQGVPSSEDNAGGSSAETFDGKNGGDSSENLYENGKLRFLMFDEDLIWQTESSPIYFPGSRGDVFRYLMEKSERAQAGVFPELMEAKEYRDRFLTLLCDLMNTSFSDESLNAVFDTELSRIMPAMTKIYGEEFISGIETGLRELRSEMVDRKEVLQSDLTEYFGVSETYLVMLAASEGVSVTWGINGSLSEGTYVCEYYVDADITYTALPGENYSFRYWLVNGNAYLGESITIRKDMIEDGIVTVRAVCEENGNCPLEITGAATGGTEDLVYLTNVSAKIIDLKAFALSDDPAEPEKQLLPDMLVYPGERVTLYGSKNSSVEASKHPEFRLSFSFSSEEEIILSKNGEIIEVLVPGSMQEGEIYSRQGYGNMWRYEKRN